jgi:uncharacterized protein
VANEATESTAPNLVAEILFQTENITAVDGTSANSAELVQKDSSLARLSPTKDPNSMPFPCVLLEGENSYLSDDKTEIFSRIDGYPLLTTSTENGVNSFLFTITPFCNFAADKMVADMTLYPAVRGGVELSVDRIKELFSENEIRFGFSEGHIQELLDKCQESRSKIIREPVARGLLPMNGKDSFLRFAIEVGPLPGKILGNGKIDFRERKMFVGVKEGQTIATRVPATIGTPGLDVSKEQVEQMPGRDLPVVVSDDAIYNEDTGTITASKSGILSMVGENSIKVCAKQVISGNIDYSTGNIQSNDAVEISGSILPGFKVVTHGDLLLGGNARSAIIICKGNLVIKGGIRGHQCKVTVEGDADFSFMEKGRLRVKKNVIIRKQAYYTRIMADGDILCAEKSQIMAGELLCGGSITLGSVGSSNSPSALIAAGVSPAIYLRYLHMRTQLLNNSEELALFLQRFGLEKKVEERESLEKHIRTLKREMRQLDLIPGSTKAEKSHYISAISITVQGKLFSGTELQIGNATKTIHYDRERVRFSLEKESQDFIESEL